MAALRPAEARSPTPARRGRQQPNLVARCLTLSTKQLQALQDVASIGGAINYTQAAMVRASNDWWTVAVATQLHLNSGGYTTRNVPGTVLFVTNSPSYKASTTKKSVYFPLKERAKDTAAAAAPKCLGR